MPRGDATAGRGYQEQNAAKPNGHTEAFPVPMGDNPYFPDAPAKPEQAGSDEDTAANDIQASEEGQPEVVEQDEGPEPTFDEDTDRANGIDVTSAEYKHFQRSFTKLRQRDKTGVEKQLEQMQARMDAEQARRKLEEPKEQPAPTQDAVKLSFEGFPVPRLPEGSQLAGLEEEIVELFKPMAQAVINDVARQQQAAFQRMQTEQTKAQITNFVSEIERTHPEKVSGILEDLESFAAVAKSNPEKWINFVKKSHGLDAQDEPAPKQTPSPQRLAQKQQSAVPRPTSSNGVTSVRAQPKTLRDAIGAALDAQGIT